MDKTKWLLVAMFAGTCFWFFPVLAAMSEGKGVTWNWNVVCVGSFIWFIFAGIAYGIFRIMK